jgi:hypothetical protein
MFRVQSSEWLYVTCLCSHFVLLFCLPCQMRHVFIECSRQIGQAKMHQHVLAATLPEASRHFPVSGQLEISMTLYFIYLCFSLWVHSSYVSYVIG